MDVFTNLGEEKAKKLFEEFKATGMSDEDAWDEVYSIECNYDDENYEFDWDGCCPYCGSDNVDIVDEGDEDVKWICKDCGEDFLIDNINGVVTDRHNRPIKRKEE